MVRNGVEESRGFTVENNVYKGPVVKNPSNYKSIGDAIWDKLSSHGDKIAHVDARTEETVTYAELQVKTMKCALWLKEQGIGRGDIISVCTDNHLNSIVPCLAASYVSVIFNTWNDNMDLPTALHCLKLIKPKAIFCIAKCLGVIRKALNETNYRVKVVAFDDCADAFPFSDILNGYGNADVANFRCVTSDEKEIVVIMHSSGTTGMPKGVELSNICLLDAIFCDFMDMNDMTSLWFSCLYWITGVLLNLKAIMQGAKLLLYPVFDEETTCVLIDKYKVDTIFLSTSMINRFLKAGYIKNYSLSSLKVILCGGAILKPKTQADLRKQLPHVNILQAYGMTELGGVAAVQKPGNKDGSCGVVAQNAQIKIVDPDTGKVLGPNESGEIWLKVASMMKGYYNNPEATKNTVDEDGWLHTGDIGYVDEDGELFIYDRIKELLKYRGYQISPGEIEAVLSKHPAVYEVAVVGVPHEIDNDHPFAFVTKKPGAEVTEQELIDFVANNMMDQYKLRGGLAFLDRFPYTGSGKIARKELRAMAEELAAA